MIAIAQVDRRSDEGLDEIEDCWKLRDAGYNTVWLSEVRAKKKDMGLCYFYVGLLCLALSNHLSVAVFTNIYMTIKGLVKLAVCSLSNYRLECL